MTKKKKTKEVNLTVEALEFVSSLTYGMTGKANANMGIELCIRLVMANKNISISEFIEAAKSMRSDIDTNNE